jgi:colanic acid biosynthesis glycosyl transferase WcaI
VLILPLQEYHKYLELIFLADIHLLPQSIGVADSVLPSKLMMMMASGSPVVAAALSGTELSNILLKKGLVCDPRSAIEFRQKVLELVYSPDLRKHLGREAKEYAFKHFGKEKILGDVIGEMSRLSS